VLVLKRLASDWIHMVCYHSVGRGDIFFKYELDLYSICDRLKAEFAAYRFYMLLIR
jgi:MoaA/NifB/PqqE/SkfB family radical SAM enzyme